MFSNLLLISVFILKFEQVSSDGDQMSLVRGGPGSEDHVQRKGGL